MGPSKFSGLKAVRKQQAAEGEDTRPEQANASEEFAVDEGSALVVPAAPEAPRRGRPPGKRSDTDYTQVTAYIRKNTHRDVRLALLTADDERDFSDLVEELLAEWLRNG